MRDFVLDHANRTNIADIRTTCPACGPNRKLIHRREQTLSITVHDDRAVYLCHHCAVSGAVRLRDDMPVITRAVRPPAVLEVDLPISADGGAYLAGRLISAETAAAAGVRSTKAWFREAGREADALAFPYLDIDGVPAWKLRSLEGKYFSCKGAPHTLFGFPADGAQEIIITEGELDALACREAGFANAVSVPSGALNENLAPGVELTPSGKLGFLLTHAEAIKRCRKVTVATDGDRQGQLLAEELCNRIGRSKCFVVQFPPGLKDMNEVLMKLGLEAVHRLLEDAKPCEVPGLHSVSEYKLHVDDLYRHGLRGGEKTGWNNVDNIMSVKTGMLYVVTGIPGSGKSSWIDDLSVNLAKNAGWATVMASFENPPSLHIAKLASAYARKPFADKYGDKRMAPHEMDEACTWLSKHYQFMSCDAAMPTVQSVLERARVAIVRNKAKVVVMDPANFLAHVVDQDTNEQVDQALIEFKNFAMAEDVAFFLVAHPKKPGSESGHGWYPKGYSIAGTAGFYNRADVGLTIHRNEDDFTRVICWKARFGHIATIGEATLSYDISTGNFSESKVRSQKPEDDDGWY